MSLNQIDTFFGYMEYLQVQKEEFQIVYCIESF